MFLFALRKAVADGFLEFAYRSMKIQEAPGKFSRYVWITVLACFASTATLLAKGVATSGKLHNQSVRSQRVWQLQRLTTGILLLMQDCWV